VENKKNRKEKHYLNKMYLKNMQVFCIYIFRSGYTSMYINDDSLERSSVYENQSLEIIFPLFHYTVYYLPQINVH
jgi:hypothetical protein